MEILLANHSSYPGNLVDEVIREQEAAGLDLVTDGQVHWADPVSHVLAQIDGVRLDGPRRFLDTKAEFRQPVIEAKLRRRRSLLVGEFRQAAQSARANVKAVMVGPYTLARLSRIETTAYRTVAVLAGDLATILAEEIRVLAEAGARYVQVDEPLILAHPGDIRLLRELLEPLKDAAGDACQLLVATYFGDAEPLYAQLNSLPADVIALDVASGPRLIDAIAATGAGRLLALGIVDGRSTRLETAEAVAALVNRATRRYVHERIYLQPSCGLAYLPPARARAKLEILQRTRKAYHRLNGSDGLP